MNKSVCRPILCVRVRVRAYACASDTCTHARATERSSCLADQCDKAPFSSLAGATATHVREVPVQKQRLKVENHAIITQYACTCISNQFLTLIECRALRNR